MAFNKPIDADRVDDLGLLSSILRAPIIGPVFWVIGKLTKQQHNELDSAAVVCKAVPRDSFATIIDESVSTLEIHVSNSLCSKITDQIGVLSDEIHRTNALQEASPNCSKHFKQDLPPPLKKTRKTSWSDESGHLLVNYCDATEPTSSSSGFRTIPALIPPNKPMLKSAMRRASDKTNIDSTQFIPSSGSDESTTGQREVGFIFPSNETYNGYVSPQWGWYATGSSTPPTPEQFYSSLPPKNVTPASNISEVVHSQQNKPEEDIHIQMQKIHLTDQPRASLNTTSRMKPVLKKGMPRDASGWPSVPL